MPFYKKTKDNLIYVFFVKGREKENKCQSSPMDSENKCLFYTMFWRSFIFSFIMLKV